MIDPEVRKSKITPGFLVSTISQVVTFRKETSVQALPLSTYQQEDGGPSDPERARSSDGDGHHTAINGRGFTYGLEMTHGGSLTRGNGLINGLALTKGRGPSGSKGVTASPHFKGRGLTNGDADQAGPGFEVRIDLINGFSIQPKATVEVPRSGWRGRTRRRRASLEVLRQKSEMPLPGIGRGPEEHGEGTVGVPPEHGRGGFKGDVMVFGLRNDGLGGGP